MNTQALIGYSTYIPRLRLQLAEVSAALGGPSSRGSRVIASFDEDSTTMGVEAAAALLRAHPAEPASLYLATTSPPYLDKTNAAAIHAALGLPRKTFVADMAGSARSGIAAWKAAATDGGLAVLADVRVGRPGSIDERSGGDGAAALLFGDPSLAIAEVMAQHSVSIEILDRWRAPGEPAGGQWEERFGLDAYLPLLKDTAVQVLSSAGLDQPDHLVVVSPNPGIAKQARRIVPTAVSTTVSPIGHVGAADVGLGLADALDRAAPGESILLLCAADGCDAILLRTTDRLVEARQAHSVADQLASGIDIAYPTYLTWRGWLNREPPRRPEPDRPAAPPSARSATWKFGFTGSVCRGCGFVHLPPVRICKNCGLADSMESRALAGATGTVATYTVDRLAYTPSPPLIDAVVDFEGGGRYTLEVADAEPDQLQVGTAVGLTFRRLFTAGGVHNYFWKARILDETSTPVEVNA
ncbi:OB-fold domain-containing protein [Nocardia neocaledoniensis]|uniref:OB-fold domain-containing protein n=1 Tax=Nocardia neocaledoniensis TaxID=236511 RepID=UPI0024579031|nr:OB-fold domain-containing protein [Nocardia neocaledoniensis]